MCVQITETVAISFCNELSKMRLCSVIDTDLLSSYRVSYM